ncbi:hypothetical protein [Streptomyces sp. NPDC001135]
MRVDGHAPGRSAPDGRDAGELLRRCARDVAGVAEDIRAVSARTGSALRAVPLTVTARRRPRTGLAARWALLRALTHGQGLGAPAITAPKGVSRMLGRESLAALVAVASLRLRIAALLVDHPGFARDPGMRRLLEAVTADRGPAAVRALRALFRDRSAQRVLSGLAPLMAELLAVRALLEEETEHDGAGRVPAAGGGPPLGPDDLHRLPPPRGVR